MQNQQEIAVKVTIAERQYPLRVKQFEEEYLRKAAKLINEKMLGYSNSFSFKDRQDLLAMVCLEFATDALTANKTLHTIDSNLLDKIVEIETILKTKDK